jgi:hypothetical protein
MAVVQSLALPQIGAVQIDGVGGIIQSMPSYPVQITIHYLPHVLIEAVANSGESWILLGRDVLNTYRIHLDGPGLIVEIDQ